MWWRSIVFIGTVMGIMVFVVPNVLWLLSWITGRLFSVRVPYLPFLYAGLGLMCTVWIALVYGYFVGRFRIEVNNVEYVSHDVPKAFDGFRIVHISDMHADSFDDCPEKLQQVMDCVNAQNADIILFTGDMNTGDMHTLYTHEKVLRSLTAKNGVVSILGNHDFFIYCPQYRNNTERCAAADTLTTYEREALGWKVLRNQSLILHRETGVGPSDAGIDSIAIAGVDNINGNQGFRTIQKGDLEKAMAGLDGVFTVLMTHDPSHWKAEVLPMSHAQITLSGHTHAAQIRILGWSLANLTFSECDGRYEQDGRMLYVNSGIGCTALFRIGCPSEVTVITLRHRTP